MRPFRIRFCLMTLMTHDTHDRTPPGKKKMKNFMRSIREPQCRRRIFAPEKRGRRLDLVRTTTELPHIPNKGRLPYNQCSLT